MRGEFQYTIDAKGRVSFPPKLREDLGEHFVIFKGLDPCLWVYSAEDWAVFEQKLAALPAKARKIQQFYSANFECEPDAQGRVLIPQTLRQFAGLKKEVVFAGVQRRVEIWDSDAWTEHNRQIDRDEVASLMDEMGL